MLTIKKKKYFKRLLSQRLDELLTAPNEIAGSKTGFRDHSPDPLDRASMESQTAFVLRIRERERVLIRKIEHALNKLEDGTFRICDECDEEISEGRLKARPVATLCINCKEQQENQEEIRGL
jgi:DnaK suppressor protein